MTFHPFADLIGLTFDTDEPTASRCQLTVTDDLLNPNGVLHGAVLYALADTGMGGVLFITLDKGQSCATIEIKISYFKSVKEGLVTCTTRIVNRGRRVVSLESEIMNGDRLVAKATGTYAIFSA